MTQWNIPLGAKTPDGPATITAPKWSDDYEANVTAEWHLPPDDKIDPKANPFIDLDLSWGIDKSAINNGRRVFGIQDGRISRWQLTVPGFKREVKNLRLVTSILRNGTETVSIDVKGAVLRIEAPDEPDYPVGNLPSSATIWVDDPPDFGNWGVRKLLDVWIDNVLEVRWRRLYATLPGIVDEDVRIGEFLDKPRRTSDTYSLPRLRGEVLEDRTGMLIVLPKNSLKRSRVYEISVSAKAQETSLFNSFRIRMAP